MVCSFGTRLAVSVCCSSLEITEYITNGRLRSRVLTINFRTSVMTTYGRRTTRSFTRRIKNTKAKTANLDDVRLRFPRDNTKLLRVIRNENGKKKLNNNNNNDDCNNKNPRKEKRGRQHAHNGVLRPTAVKRLKKKNRHTPPGLRY